MKRTRIVEAVTWILVLLFAYTGFSKLFSLQQFETVLWQAPLIGPRAGLVARAVPITELIIAGALVIPALQQKALWAAFILLVLFTAYLGYMLTLSSHLPCQCGGVISSMSWQAHLLFNLFFIGLTAYSLFVNNSGNTNYRSSAHRQIIHA